MKVRVTWRSDRGLYNKVLAAMIRDSIRLFGKANGVSK